MKIYSYDDEVLRIKKSDFRIIEAIADLQLERAEKVIAKISANCDIDTTHLLNALEVSGFKLIPVNGQEKKAIRMARFLTVGLIRKTIDDEQDFEEALFDSIDD